MRDGGTEAPDLLKVTRADAAVDRFTADLLRELSPEWRTVGWLGLEHWQWVALPVLLVLAALGTWGLVWLTQRLASWLLRTHPDWQRTVERQSGPLKLWWASWLGRLVLLVVSPGERLAATLDTALEVSAAAAFFWGLQRALQSWSERYLASSFAVARPGSRALVGLLSRAGQFLVIGFGIIAVLSLLGYQVGNVLAGLGIGGIALALGAQKTLENVFGAFALAIDQPMREGDFVMVDGTVMGTVERIGLRSTQVRTLDRTVVTIPNGKLSDMRLENYAERDRFRLLTVLTLRAGTTAEQLEAVLMGFREILRAEEKLWSDYASVRLMALNNGAFDVEVLAWLNATDMDEFRVIRERVLLGFVRCVEQAGTRFALPAQAVELRTAPSEPGPVKEM